MPLAGQGDAAEVTGGVEGEPRGLGGQDGVAAWAHGRPRMARTRRRRSEWRRRRRRGWWQGERGAAAVEYRENEAQQL